MEAFKMNRYFDFQPKSKILGLLYFDIKADFFIMVASRQSRSSNVVWRGVVKFYKQHDFWFNDVWVDDTGVEWCTDKRFWWLPTFQLRTDVNYLLVDK